MLDAPNYQYPTGVAYSTGDLGTVALVVDGNGEYVPKRLPPAPKFVPISVSASGVNTIVAAVAGKKIRVISYVLTAKDEVRATWRSGTTNLTGALFLKETAQPIYMAGSFLLPLFETVAGEALVLFLSGSQLVTGHLTYVEVD